MPVFEYLCDICHKQHTVLEKFEEKTETCPYCLNRSLKRQISTAGFTFKNPAGTTQRSTQDEI